MTPGHEQLRQRGIPAAMAGAFATIQVFSTVGTTFMGLNIEILLMAYVGLLVLLTARPDVHVLHNIALPLSVIATWGRAEGFATLAIERAPNVWGTSALFAAVGVFMLTWHVEQLEQTGG